MAAPQLPSFLQNYNTKRVISPEREGLEAQILTGLYWGYIYTLKEVIKSCKIFS